MAEEDRCEADGLDVDQKTQVEVGMADSTVDMADWLEFESILPRNSGTLGMMAEDDRSSGVSDPLLRGCDANIMLSRHGKAEMNNSTRPRLISSSISRAPTSYLHFT